jgi:hypothetical protein
MVMSHSRFSVSIGRVGMNCVKSLALSKICFDERVGPAQVSFDHIPISKGIHREDYLMTHLLQGSQEIDLENIAPASNRASGCGDSLAD